MSSQGDIEKSFLATLVDLQDILDKILVVGGWCPFLYAKYLWKIPTENIPRTTDIDFGVWETGSVRYDPTVYARLLAAGYETEAYSSTDNEQVEFLRSAKDDKLKIEFITSFYVSDDTLQRFLGGRMACHRIEGFEILLQAKPLVLDIKARNQILRVKCINPAVYLYHKGLTFVARSGTEKRDKDMLYIYYVLRYCPAVVDLIKGVKDYRKNEEFKLFQKNIIEYFETETSPGYRALNPFLSPWMRADKIESNIKSAFAPLLAQIKRGKRK